MESVISNLAASLARSFANWAVLLFTILLFPPLASAQDMSALVGQAMDKQLPKSRIDFTGTLPQAIQNFGDLTGVRIEADSTVYDALPWGELTTFSARYEHQTLRQSLAAICQKLGLEYELGKESIHLHPLPALVRLGRRCTIEELAALDLLARTPLEPNDLYPTPESLIAAIDAKLRQTTYAIENRGFDVQGAGTVTISRNATLLEALEEIQLQTDATWYPWGKSLVVIKKPELIRMLLAKPITTRYSGQDISQVLLDLSQRSGVNFQIDPGVEQQIPAQFRTVRLILDNATVQQALESICGFTGLSYAVMPSGIHVSYVGPASPATHPQ
ncbi:MAG: hypothetical protein M3O30_02175 [Planctomycetota bacterium]|nr:hypothetical protein [Planctomycetota bacterium]